jgi:enoyl-[acyl-carrier-protein] reductase (NADH)
MYTLDLSGKKGVVFGVTNQRSIGWAIAEKLSQAGARFAFGYQGERLKGTLEKLTAGLENPLLLQCDATRDDELDAVFGTLQQEFGQLDFLVHSVAFAPPRDLRTSLLRGFARGLEHGDGRVRLFARGDGAAGAAAHDSGGQHPGDELPCG